MIRDILGALGSWELKLRDGTPDEVLTKLDYFGHVAVVRGDVSFADVGDSALPQARYVGILRQRTPESIAGVGMIAWLGDEDGKGQVIENKITLSNATFAQAIAAVLPSAVTTGFVGTIAGTYTGTHQFETPRAALDTICAAFGAEFYVSGDAKLYAGTRAQLYGTTANTIVARRNAGVDLDLVALGGQFETAQDVIDYSTRVLLVGQTTEAGTFATGSADAPSVPYKDQRGGVVKRTRMISESGTTEGSVAQRAALALNRFNRQRTSLKVTTEKYETTGTFRVGENSYVFDPESGIFDSAREVAFRGEVLHPDLIRVTGISYPIADGHSVGFRRGDGTWLDLTRYVVWETGTNEVTVGDLPKSLGGTSPNPVRDRADAASVDVLAPKPPTVLDVQTSVIDTGTNGLVGQAAMSWTAPTQNSDSSALTDLDGYLPQLKFTTSPSWSSAGLVAGTSTVVQVVPGRNYDFRVYAVDKNGNRSDPSTTISKLTVLDTTPPGPPSDPTLSSFIGQLRIKWDGKLADGSNPPADFFQVDVHVSDVSGFTPTPATLVSSLLEAGVAFATAPYGSPRYVKLIALDRSANASIPSGQATGSTVMVNDGDVAALNVGKLVSGTMTAEVAIGGRFATALTGARVELNGTGIYKVMSDGTFAVAIDGTQALLTGVYKTAVTGRRLEIASAGAIGKMRFINPDGTESSILGFTSTNATGEEALVFNGPNKTPGGAAVTTMQLIETGQMQYRAGNHQFTMEDLGGSTLTHGFGVYEEGSLRLGVSAAGVSMYGSGDALRAYVYQGGFRAYGNNSAQALDVTDNGMIVWAGGSANPRLFIDNANGRVTIRPSEYGNARFELTNAGVGGVDTGASLNMYANNGLGVTLRVAANSGSQQLDVVNPAQNVWYSLRASQFLVQSDENAKTDIKDVSKIDMLTDILAMPVKRYHRMNRVDGSDNPCMNSREEVGFIAQQTPSRVSYKDTEAATEFVDTYQTLALTVGATQALNDLITGLRKDVNDMKGKMLTLGVRL